MQMVNEKEIRSIPTARAASERDRARWVIDVTEACHKRNIENPYQLWQKIGGSKGTAAQLFAGTSQMIRTDTMDTLHRVLGITPFEYIVNRPE
jgi:hypothetical protein